MNVIRVVALSVPLLVALIVCVVARTENTPLPVGALVRLVVATTAALVIGQFLPDPRLTIVMSLAVFALFVTPVTRAIERAARPRATERVRSADLVPRTVGIYVPLTARVALVVAGAGLLSWIISLALAEPFSLMTTGCTVAALTFYGLYEAWIHQEVIAVRAMSDAERRSRVRSIFVAQIVLTLGFLVLAALAAGPSPGLTTLGVIAAILGSIGCGLALSTGIQQRYLDVPAADLDT